MTIPGIRQNITDYIAEETAVTTDYENPDIFKDTETITIPFVNIKVDKISTYIYIGCIVILILFWKIFDFFEIVKQNNIFILFLIIPILFFILQIIVSDTKIGSEQYESTKMVHIEQISSVFAGSVILFLALNKDKKEMMTTNEIIMLVIIISISLTSITNNSNKNQRSIRIFKQGILSLSVILFCTNIYIVILHKNMLK